MLILLLVLNDETKICHVIMFRWIQYTKSDATSWRSILQTTILTSGLKLLNIRAMGTFFSNTSYVYVILLDLGYDIFVKGRFKVPVVLQC